MVQVPAIPETVTLWMRRVAFCFVGLTSATGTLTLVLAGLLVVSGVLEW